MTPIALGSQDPPKKKGCLNRETTKTPVDNQPIQSTEARLTPVLSTATTQVGTLSLIGKIEHGQTTQILENEVLGYKDLPMEAYEFNALLRLQKIGWKKQATSSPLLMELPDFNTALVEANRDLDHTTRVAKQMVRCSKTSQKQAERATELWQAVEQRITVLEQQLQDRKPLGLPPPSNNSQPSPP